MSGESDATATLQAALSAPLQAVARKVLAARDAQTVLRGAADLVETMQGTTGVILAMEALAEAATAAEKAARAALAEAMQMGATTVTTPFHTVSLRRTPRRVIVTDASQIPAHFMVQPPTPPPAPDLQAIAFQLREGREVPGAVLSNSGADTIQIKPRKVAA